MTQNLFLWPKPKVHFRNFLVSTNLVKIEDKIKKLFPFDEAVIFSSARSVLTSCLVYYEINRDDLISYPPYSSHCVLESISRIGSPILQSRNSCKLNVIFHQWGYQRKYNFKDFCIEDSADSLLIPGKIDYPNKGEFQIVSLPKILGNSGGSIVFCKDLRLADKLREIRDKRKNISNIQYLIRLVGMKYNLFYMFWSGMETTLGYPSNLLCRDIDKSIDRWNEKVEKRKKLWNILDEKKELSFSKDRLPCVYPLEDTYLNLKLAQECKLIIGKRYFLPLNESQTGRMVIPIPIHEDVPIFNIQSLLTKLKFVNL
jgi:putative PLP-dependent aminotransferase (TIGR04422 family)